LTLSTDTDVAIIGGGAAGLLCAAVAGARGRRAVVLEGSNRPGKKILMSGGGRCNFTNLACEPAHFQSQNPHFCKSALKRYTPYDFLSLVDKHRIPYVEKAPGQLFCEHSSKDIVAMLLAECETAGVTLVTDAGVGRVERDSRWRIDTAHGVFAADAVVVASGGLSIPKMGATGFGYELARQFGLDVVETRAGLVPFTFTGALHDTMAKLSGVSVPAAIEVGKRRFYEAILFTHRGLSGPAALQASSFWQPGDDLVATLRPGVDWYDTLVESKRRSPAAALKTALAALMPRALAAELPSLLADDAADTPLVSMSNKQLKALAEKLTCWRLRPAATEGYRTAEVTLGGVDTHALSSSTMECRDVPGLYFIGEVVDVTGELGGFNFQWAWASAHAAGEVA
jgi:predicted Rossmann fold flavoprotein